MLKPKLFTTIKDYSKEQFISDIIAGAVVGIVALPLAIAFGIASGVTPEAGIITAIIGGFLVSFLGGSRVQIAGPTGAFIVIVYSIIQKYGIEGLTIATILAGIILLLLGFSKLGGIIKFIPYPVTIGFTSGIAVVIFSSQIKDFFGLDIKKLPADFIEKWELYVENISTINVAAFGVGIFSLLVIVLWQRYIKKIPGSLVAIIFSSAIVYFFKLPAETIGDRFGQISSSLPTPQFPSVEFSKIKELIQPAFSIAILGAIESLLSAVVADGMIGGKHRSNMELVAQGIANIVTPLFGGIPVTGAIARTATNIKNGGRTPIAGIVHSIVLLIIMLFLLPLAMMIPMASLAAVLIVVSYNMAEKDSFVSLLKQSKSDATVLILTFLLTVLIDLTVAIQIGLALAVFLFMRRMALVSNVVIVTRELQDESEEKEDPNAIDKREVPEGVEVFEINGPFFFGAAYKFTEAINLIEKHPKILIIRMRNVPAIDATGIYTLKQAYYEMKRKGGFLVLSGVHSQPLIALQQSGFLDEIGEDNVHGNIDDALDRAREILGLPKKGRPVNFVPTVKRDIQK